MILYLRYCRTGVLFHITVNVKDQYVTTYDDVILVKPNRISVLRYSCETEVLEYDIISYSEYQVPGTWYSVRLRLRDM